MSKQKAQREAASLLARLDVRNIPVDVESIATRLGLALAYEDFEGDVSGWLVSRGAGAGGVIGVHSGQAPVRQRFTIAHEIGHFVLKHHEGEDKNVHVDEGWKVSARDSRSGTGSDPCEVEANQFAAALLMPEAALRTRVAKLKRRPLSELEVFELASEFHVSEQAMHYRLEALSLF